MTASYDFWTWMGHTSSVVTILAGIVTAIGLVSLWMTRPRPKITASSDNAEIARVYLANEGTSRELRNVWLGFVIRREDGIRHGTDADPWHDSIGIGTNRRIELFDPEQVTFGDPAGDHEKRIKVEAGASAWCQLRWQHPMIPWLTVRRVIEWTSTDRESGSDPRVLEGADARRAWRGLSAT